VADLGWETYNAYAEFEQVGSFLGRENKSEVVLLARLRPALERLNPDLQPKQSMKRLQS
jgi:type I restriction enzyme, R subunit